MLVTYEGLQLLDLCGPLEAFRVANQTGISPRYRTVVATPDGGRVRSTSGLEIGADASVADLARRRTPVDTLLVAGGLGSWQAAGDEAFVADVTALAGASPADHLGLHRRRRARRRRPARRPPGHHPLGVVRRPGAAAPGDRRRARPHLRPRRQPVDARRRHRRHRPHPRARRGGPRPRGRPPGGRLARRVRPPPRRPGPVQRRSSRPSRPPSRASPPSNAGCPTTSTTTCRCDALAAAPA